MVSKEYKSLVVNVYSLWNKQKKKAKKNPDQYIYQYTDSTVLEKMSISQSLRLIPVNYQNDPQEGKALFDYLANSERLNKNMRMFFQDLCSDNYHDEDIVFIRSLTSNEDSLVMWDSSYSDNGKGVSIGIKGNILTSGTGIDPDDKTLKYDNVNKESNQLIAIEKLGLYPILYLNPAMPTAEINNIVDSLSKIPINNNRSDKLKKALCLLFKPIAHLIKDCTYSHEQEYRLLRIEKLNSNSNCIIHNFSEGIYLETEKFLFLGCKKEKVWFGPKAEHVKTLRIQHHFKMKGLNPEFCYSNVKFR